VRADVRSTICVRSNAGAQVAFVEVMKSLFVAVMLVSSGCVLGEAADPAADLDVDQQAAGNRYARAVLGCSSR